MRWVFLPGQYITVPLRQLSSCLVRFSSLYRAFSQTKSKCLFSPKTTAGRCFTPIITIGFFNSQIRFLHLSLQNVISLFSTQHSSTSQSFCHRLHWPFFPALCLSQVEGECHLCLLPTCSQCHLTAQGKSENRDSHNRFTGDILRLVHAITAFRRVFLQKTLPRQSFTPSHIGPLQSGGDTKISLEMKLLNLTAD